MTGEPDGAPMKTGLSLFDLTAGLHGVAGPNEKDMLMVSGVFSDSGCLVQKMQVLTVLVTSMTATYFLVGLESFGFSPSDPRALEVIGILAALNSKHNTGLGQHVDISMLDVAVALLANQGMNYLAKKQRQKRVGNNHPNVVPYQVMPAKDGGLSTRRI